mgnify:CR=1 FL=1
MFKTKILNSPEILERSFDYIEKQLNLAVETIYDALTTVWENNGNIMADAVRDESFKIYQMSQELF